MMSCLHFDRRQQLAGWTVLVASLAACAPSNWNGDTSLEDNPYVVEQRSLVQAVSPALGGYVQQDAATRDYLIIMGPNYHLVSGCDDDQEILTLLDLPADTVVLPTTEDAVAVDHERGFALGCKPDELGEVDISEPFYQDDAQQMLYVRTGTQDEQGNLQQEYYSLPIDEPYVNSTNSTVLFHTSLFATYDRWSDAWTSPADALVIELLFAGEATPEQPYFLRSSRDVDVAGLDGGTTLYYFIFGHKGADGSLRLLRVAKINGQFVDLGTDSPDPANMVSYLNNTFGLELPSAIPFEPNDDSRRNAPFLDLCMSCDTSGCGACEGAPTAEHGVLQFDEGSTSGAWRPLEAGELTLTRQQDLYDQAYLAWPVGDSTRFLRWCDAFLSDQGLLLYEDPDSDWLQERSQIVEAMQAAEPGTRPLDIAFECPRPKVECVRQTTATEMSSFELQDWLNDADGTCSGANQLTIEILADLHVSAVLTLAIDANVPFERVVLRGAGGQRRVVFSFSARSCSRADPVYPWLCADTVGKMLRVADGRELVLEDLVLTGEKWPGEELSPKAWAVAVNNARLMAKRTVIGQDVPGENPELPVITGVFGRRAQVYLTDSRVNVLETAVDLMYDSEGVSRFLSYSAQGKDAATERRLWADQMALNVGTTNLAFVYGAHLYARTIAFVGHDAELHVLSSVIRQHANQAPQRNGMFELYNDDFHKYPVEKVFIDSSEFRDMVTGSDLNTLYLSPIGDVSGRVRIQRSSVYEAGSTVPTSDSEELAQLLNCGGLTGGTLLYEFRNYCTP